MSSILRRAYWQATAFALALGLCGVPAGAQWATGLTAVQLLHCIALRGTLCALDVQVRGLVLAVLLAGSLPLLGWLHGLQLAGLLAMLVTDYCLAARLLTLLPWNRDVPFSAGLLRWVLLSPPAPGPLAERMEAALRARR